MPIDKEVTVIEARDWIAENRSLHLIDVRSEAEYEKGSIPGFRNIPLQNLSRAIPELDSKRVALLLCANGDESTKGQQLLEACGMRSYVIRGGIQDWSEVIDPTVKP